MNRLSHYYRWRRPTCWAWVAFATAFFTLLALGVWQLERLRWKQELLQQIETSQQAIPHKGIPTAPSPFQRLRIEGRFVGGDELHITPRYHAGVLGYHIVQPFQLAESGTLVLVNRGWVPADNKDIATRPASAAPTGELTLSVQLRDDTDRHIFTPASRPEKNIFFGRDIAGMQTWLKQHTDLRIDYPFMLDVLADANAEDTDTLPIPLSGEVTLRNDHLHYAITWFLLALSCLIVFVIYHSERTPRISEPLA